MMISQCFFCNKTTYTPYRITEITDGTVESYRMCKKCGDEFMSDFKKPEPKKEVELDLSHIKTPEELLGFIQNMREGLDELPPCEGCGLTLKEFDKHGRFGCPKCYEHFEQRMEELVYPFHKAREHVGKRPKHQIEKEIEQDPVEKLKLLKLRYAKALELEEYEKCGDLKKQIDELSQSLSSASEDQ